MAPPRGEPKHLIAIRIPERLLPELERRAARHGTTVTGYIQDAVIVALERDTSRQPASR